MGATQHQGVYLSSLVAKPAHGLHIFLAQGSHGGIIPILALLLDGVCQTLAALQHKHGVFIQALYQLCKFFTAQGGRRCHHAYALCLAQSRGRFHSRLDTKEGYFGVVITQVLDGQGRCSVASHHQGFCMVYIAQGVPQCLCS